MKLAPVALVASLFCGSATAEMAESLDQLLTMSLSEILQVEVATGTVKQVSEAPAVVSVITAEDITLMGATTLSEALEKVPGLHVIPSINRLTPMYSVRGIFTDNTPQILVMIDGIETSEITASSVPYAFRLPTNFIERIEIVRGPGSAVYGADAFSGVINVITKKFDDAEPTTLGVRLGSFDGVEGWVNTHFAIEDVTASLSVTLEKENNDNDRITHYGVMQRKREMQNLHLNLSYQNFTLTNWYWHTNQQMGVGAGINGNAYDKDKMASWHSQLKWSEALSKNTDASIDVSYGGSDYDARFLLFPAGVWPVGSDGNVFGPPFTPVSFPNGVIGEPKGKSTRAEFNASVIHRLSESHTLRSGVGFERARLKDIKEFKNFGPGVLDTVNLPSNGISDTLIDVSGSPFVYTPDYDRDLWYAFVQDEWQVTDKVAVTAGLRFDKYSDFGSTTNPRLAVVWSTSETLTTKVMLGTAFRAPKVSELAFINNPTTLGNLALQPEKNRTLEVAFDYRPYDYFIAKVNLFSYQSEDLIQLDQTFVFQNRGEQDGEGVEIEAQWQFSEALRVEGNISWLDAELPATGEDKERVPGLMGYMGIVYQLTDTLVFSAQNYWIKDRKREAIDTRPPVDDYTKTDINLLWQPNAKWRVAVGAKNLFNDNIVEPVPGSALFALGLGFPDDYPMQSRKLFASASYTF